MNTIVKRWNAAAALTMMMHVIVPSVVAVGGGMWSFGTGFFRFPEWLRVASFPSSRLLCPQAPQSMSSLNKRKRGPSSCLPVEEIATKRLWHVHNNVSNISESSNESRIALMHYRLHSCCSRA